MRLDNYYKTNRRMLFDFFFQSILIVTRETVSCRKQKLDGLNTRAPALGKFALVTDA